MSNEFYTYLYLRVDSSPYQVGKGQGQRAYQRGKNHYPPKDRCRIQIIPCPSEEVALEYEKLLISCYGRKDNGTGILRNLTDGGEGISGWIHSPETKIRCRAASRVNLIGNQRAKGSKWSQEQRASLSEIRKHQDKRQPYSALAIEHFKQAAQCRDKHKANHIRWHANRNINSPVCRLCQEKV